MFTGFPHLMELIKKLKLTKILEMIFCLQDYWGTSPHGGGLGSAQSAACPILNQAKPLLPQIHAH